MSAEDIVSDAAGAISADRFVEISYDEIIPNNVALGSDKQLQRALDRNSSARRNFDRLDRINRYAILYRVHDAKKAETRVQRIEKYVAMLSRGETIHPTSRTRKNRSVVK